MNTFNLNQEHIASSRNLTADDKKKYKFEKNSEESDDEGAGNSNENT